ncbi:TMEM199/VMA12 family protein [Sporobolomyces koalae]|uniref:TMEM199/VMA12 family protein n=1 Tax=Sporobolomyces koalae TaxID=500713 RepID=UPI0031708BA2
MVLLTVTRDLETRLDLIKPVLPAELVHLIEVTSLQDQETNRTTTTSSDRVTIDHTLLVRVSEWIKDCNGDEVRAKLDLVGGKDAFRLSSLLKLTNVDAPPLAPREKSPELVAILASIQLEQDRQDYAAMTSLETPLHRSLLPLSDPHARSDKTTTVADEWSEIRKELSAIVNVLASMAAVFTGVWYVGFGYGPATRLGLSLMGAMTIAAIEGWLYYRVFSRVKQGKLERVQPRTSRKSTTTTEVLKFEQPRRVESRGYKKIE